jgi:hypothetical protein
VSFAGGRSRGVAAAVASLWLALATLAAAQHSSALSAASFPRSVECGAAFEAAITLENDGEVPWLSGEVALGAVGGSDPFTDRTRVPLPAGTEVAPGGSHRFELRLTAPEIGLSAATSDWRLVTRAGTWFGATASARVVVTCPARIDDAEIITADLPAEATCGVRYAGSLTVLNNGTTTWSGSGGYALEEVAEGEPGFAPRRFPLPAETSVPPATEHRFAISLRAPREAGSFATEWRMSRRGVGAFGASVTQWVAVRCGPAAGAPYSR